MAKPADVQIDKKVVKEMLEAGCHYGHKVSKWNPKMHRFLYAKHEGVHVFDLTQAYQRLVVAMDFLKNAVMEGKSVLLVSTKLQATRLLTEAAEKTGCSYVTRKWIPGLLTNFDTVKIRIRYFKELKEQQGNGEWESKYTKKERLQLARELTKLQAAFGGVEYMNSLPDVVVVLDVVRDKLALKEAQRLHIQTVGICDSNADPDLVNFPIPGNDDAVRSISFFTDYIVNAINEGKKLSTGMGAKKAAQPVESVSETPATEAPAAVAPAPEAAAA